jgi:saccharopine dehydrogenase-like NADP-dependent oxidoreductase
MANLLIIGAGGVGRVATFKAAMNTQSFEKITLASRTKSKCEKIANDIKEKLGIKIDTYKVDADNVNETALTGIIINIKRYSGFARYKSVNIIILLLCQNSLKF